MKAFYLCVGLVLCSGTLPATPLYQQRVQQAVVDESKLDEIRKQVRENKPIKLQKDLFVPPFHRRKGDTVPGRKPLCATCHVMPPHRKNSRSRSFLNMHSRYIACETCHFRPGDVRLDYVWAGEATSSDRVKKQARKNSLVPAAGMRITPRFQGELVSVPADATWAGTIRKIWQGEDETQRVLLKARLHAPLSGKGPKCLACHGRKDPMLDLQKLGASPERIRELQDNPIPAFFARFSKDQQRLRIRSILR